MIKRTALAALALASLAGGALAQTVPSSPQTFIPRSQGPDPMYMSLNLPSRFLYQAQTDRVRVKASPEEWRRAKQAAELINSNHCGEAYKLAIIEQDDRLAEGVKAICAAAPRS